MGGDPSYRSAQPGGGPSGGESPSPPTSTTTGFVSAQGSVEWTLGERGAPGEADLDGEADYDGSDGTTLLTSNYYLPVAGTWFVRVFDWGNDDWDHDQPFTLTMAAWA